MALKNNMFLVLVLTCLLMTYATAYRDISSAIKPGHNLVARLEEASGGEGGLVECWNALMELKSCSNEIIIFFLNGQADIGPNCCSAIGIIMRNCWPAMLTSLGFTAEEGDILRGYCDAAASGPVAASPIAGLPVTG